jgi:hypothetical protein
MSSLRSTAVAVVSTIAFAIVALSIAPGAHADDDTSSVPCATQQAQLDNASAKLTALAAKFAAHPSKHNQKAKKAQVQRVAHATARLDACLTGAIEEPTDSDDD